MSVVSNPPHNRHRGTPRVTIRGCKCEKDWTRIGYEDDPTTNYCANPDNDAGGEWCSVTEEGKICEGTGADWGYCAAEEAGTPGVVCGTRNINCRS